MKVSLFTFVCDNVVELLSVKMSYSQKQQFLLLNTIDPRVFVTFWLFTSPFWIKIWVSCRPNTLQEVIYIIFYYHVCHSFNPQHNCIFIVHIMHIHHFEPITQLSWLTHGIFRKLCTYSKLFQKYKLINIKYICYLHIVGALFLLNSNL